MKNLFATLALCLFMLSSCTADLDKLSNMTLKTAWRFWKSSALR